MPSNLEALSRLELLELAQRLQVTDADVMTRPELRSAIEIAQRPRPRRKEASRTWLGVARRLVASVIEQGFNLPEAASLVRGEVQLADPPAPPQPIATFTLARIYAAQGHVDRALETLEQLLASEPDHEPAQALCHKLRARLVASRPPPASVASPKSGSGPPRSIPVSSPNPSQNGAVPPETHSKRPEAQPPPEPIRSEQAARLSRSGGETSTAPSPSSSAPPPQPDKQGPAVTASQPVACDAPAPEPTASESAAQQPTVDHVEAPVLADVSAPSGEADTKAAPFVPRTRAKYPQVVLIRTDEDELFAYWEGAPAEKSHLVLVAHGVDKAPSGRQERTFPVYSASGAIELVGVQPQWVMRAMLRRGTVPGEGKALSVASCVCSEAASRPGNISVEYSPLNSGGNSTMPKAVAVRAAAYLGTAPASNW